jgi:hypothetical protein
VWAAIQSRSRVSAGVDLFQLRRYRVVGRDHVLCDVLRQRAYRYAAINPLMCFGVLFPTWFFRYARALWIAFDEHWDPWPNEEEVRRMQVETQTQRSAI